MSWLKKVLGLEPSAPAEALAPARPASFVRATASPISLAGERVLVADASQTIQKVLELSLGDEGCRITAASTVKEAIAALGQAPPPTVVLVRTLLSEDDGLVVSEAVRRRPELAATIVLAMTGAFETKPAEARLRTAGVDGVLVVPFVPAELIERLREARGARGPAR